MTFSEHITTGFDFDEAIWLAELCQRAQQLFTHESGAAAAEIYDALYQDQEWKVVRAIGSPANPARTLIVKRNNRRQYAIVFWMPESAGLAAVQAGKAAEQRAAANTQTISITNLDSPEASNGSPAQPDRMGSVAYPPLPGEVAPPALGVRVQRIWLDAIATCQKEIEQFFSEQIQANDEQSSALAPNEIEIYVSGHGGGGCLAALGALYLKRQWESRIDFPFFSLKMINFGSPKLGNKAFVDYYHKHMGGFSYRVQNLLDGATFEPATTAPFPYNLQLLLPGVDYVRDGEEYYMSYEHIGEAYILAGVGTTPSEFHFRGPFSSTTILPFPHSAAGYKQMLIEMRKLKDTYWKPVERVVAGLDKQRQQLVDVFQKQGAEIQKVVEEVQIKVMK